jgi:hypothetical protein
VRLYRTRLAAVVASLTAAGITAGVTAGCGGGTPPGSIPPSPETTPPTSARAALAARAAAAQDLVAVSSYTLTRPGGQEHGILLVRAEDGGWRVDVEGGALGGTADVAIAVTGGELFQCALPSPARPGGACVPLAELTPGLDPRIHHVFTDWPGVFTDRTAALAVSTAAPPAEGAPGECFAVEPTTASLESPVEAGIYCYAEDGTLTGAWLGLGNLVLTSTGGAAPPTVDLPGPVVDGDPLPTAPPPSPTAPASPSRSPLVS